MIAEIHIMDELISTLRVLIPAIMIPWGLFAFLLGVIVGMFFPPKTEKDDKQN